MTKPHLHAANHILSGKNLAAQRTEKPNQSQAERDRRFWWVLLTLVCVHLVLCGVLTVRYSPTVDEAAHLPAGLAVWKFQRTDLYRVNPPLVRTLAALPILFVPHEENWSHYVSGGARRCEFEVGADFVAANGVRSLKLYQWARWMCLPISLIGLLVCGLWGRELVNETGGLIAAALWCFSPNLIAHGALITPDVAATSFGLLAAWRFQHWLHQSTWRNSFWAGCALGLALLAKTYWVILLGLWPMIAVLSLLFRVLSPRSSWTVRSLPASSPRASFVMGQLVFMLLLGCNVLNLGYGFEGTGTPVGELPFFSETLSGSHRDLELDRPGNSFRSTWLGSIPSPFPRDYLTGIDLQKQDLEKAHWSYLLGEHRQRGWWYYYLVGLAVKVPVGTLVLALFGIWTAGRGLHVLRTFLRLAPLWLPALVLFVVVSRETGMNRHFRYVYPVLPLLYLGAAYAALRSKRWIPMSCVLMTAIGSLINFPDSLAFQNGIGRLLSRNQPVLIDSCLDWGQDLGAARLWILEHPECRPVTIAPVAGFSHASIGIDVPFTPSGKLVPGWHLISVHLLESPAKSYAAYQKLQPVARVGLTINIYHVEE